VLFNALLAVDLVAACFRASISVNRKEEVIKEIY